MKFEESVSYIKKNISTGNPKIGLILGSGLGDFGNKLIAPAMIDTKDIPHYPTSSVPGHAGKLLFGKIEKNGKHSAELLVFQGRVHFYECNDINTVIYPIEVAHRLGIEHLIVTNAAGGINRTFAEGTLMLIRDYINLTGENPLIGKSTAVRKYFSFDETLQKTARKVAIENSISLREGIYCWTKGPSYETAAEIRMMEKLGADAVGMSTIPEAVVAASYGIKVVGISCITNLATGLSQHKLSHTEVTEVANRVKGAFTTLVSSIIVELS